MNRSEFASRRRQLERMMGAGSIAILPSAPLRKRNRDIHYRYRQDSDFYYLSGFAEPDAVIVLAPERAGGSFLMFCRERDAKRERWDGAIAGPERVCERYDADDAFPIDDIDDILPGLLERAERVYYTMGVYPDFDQQLTEWLNALREQSSAGAHTPHEFVSLEHLLHDMRLYKSRAELTALRRAARVTVAAHRRAMRVLRPGLVEYELEAEIGHEFRSANAVHAYPPIVGGGRNACVLHYVANDCVLSDGDLVLIDAGCELDYYASDVTRTLPVGGRFSAAQRSVYEIVLAAQLAAIEELRPGRHWNDAHDAATRVIVQGLKDFGLLTGDLDGLIEREAYRRFFMHRTGHWLGIDVHDVGDYRVGDTWRELEPGMVTTVEPGIYLPDSDDIPAEFRGIGVRIEDDVAVTRDEPEVLTRALPKAPRDIEDSVRDAA